MFFLLCVSGIILLCFLINLYVKYDPKLEIIKRESEGNKMLVLWYNDYSEKGCYRTFYVITEL